MKSVTTKNKFAIISTFLDKRLKVVWNNQHVVYNKIDLGNKQSLCFQTGIANWANFCYNGKHTDCWFKFACINIKMMIM